MSNEMNLPWRYDYEPGYCGELIAANGSVICTFTDEPLPKDAAHIVRAVNNHDALVAALETVLANAPEPYCAITRAVDRQVREALAAARGEK